MRKRQQQRLFLLGIGLIFIIFLIVLIRISVSHEKQAVMSVHQFYQFEQTGKFADSWEMFHPFMKEKFSKGTYIQDRAHVFIGHFGADTFEYTIGETKLIKKWTPTEGAEEIENVYQTSVVQSYKGKYGRFTFQQNVYVTEVEGEWKIVWDYN